MKTKFLLADDDADDADLFCEALKRIGPDMECYTVENGREVFERLSAHQIPRPDVIFLDINMPVMDGWECLRKLKHDSGYKTIPAIMYSTSSAKDDIETAYKLGALLFLSKPEDFNELCKILHVVATTQEESMLTLLRGFGSVKLA